MMEKFYTLRHREQLVLVFTAMLIVLILLYVFIWRPVNEALGSKRQQYETTLQTRDAVSGYAQRIMELEQEGPGAVAGAKSLTSVVNESLEARQLQLARMQQLSADQVQIRLENVEFGEALAWLYDLENMPGLVLEELSISPVAAGRERLINVTVGLNRLH